MTSKETGSLSPFRPLFIQFPGIAIAIRLPYVRGGRDEERTNCYTRVFGAFEGSCFTKKSKLAKYIGADVLLTDSIYPDGPYYGKASLGTGLLR